MNKTNANIVSIIVACSDKINVARDERANMFQIVYGADDKQEHLTIATIYLGIGAAFNLKRKVIEAKSTNIKHIDFIADRAHLVHFHSDPTSNTHEFIGNTVIGINLEDDKVLAMTGDTLKNWNKMKQQMPIKNRI